MAVSENTGNTTSTDGTEQTLATITTAGVYQLVAELHNLANGDAIEFRIKVKGRSGSTSRVAFFATYSQAQGADSAVVMSPPIPAPFEFVATMKRVAGSDRSIIWSIYQYA